MKNTKGKLNFFVPKELVETLHGISSKRMVSMSAYCRQALVEKLERDGINPWTPKKAA
jgi:predicted HicB family RNase H-like nuclease